MRLFFFDILCNDTTMMVVALLQKKCKFFYSWTCEMNITVFTGASSYFSFFNAACVLYALLLLSPLSMMPCSL